VTFIKKSPGAPGLFFAVRHQQTEKFPSAFIVILLPRGAIFLKAYHYYCKMKKNIILLLSFFYELSSAQIGYLQWSISLSGTGNSPSYANMVNAICTDHHGNSVVVGNFAGNIDLDPSSSAFTLNSPSTTLFNAFLARYSSTNQFLGGFLIPGNQDVIASIVKPAPSHSLYVAGTYRGTMDADPDTGTFLLNSSGGYDYFIASYDSSGSLQFAFSLGSNTAPEKIHDMQVDSLGNIYITGIISDTVDFDPGPGVSFLNGTPVGSMFLAKYNPLGELLWAFMLDNPNTIQNGYSLAFDTSGNVLVNLLTAGVLDADPGPGTANFAPNASRGLLIARYSPQGTYLNAWMIGDAGSSYDQTAMVCDNQNAIWLAGKFGGNIDLNPGPGTLMVTSTTNAAVFLARYTLSGQLLHGSLPGLSNITSQSLRVDSLCSAYLVSSNMNTQSEMKKIDVNGNQIYSKSLQTTSAYIMAVELRGADNFSLGGGIRGSTSLDNTIVFGGSTTTPVLLQFGPCLIPQITDQPGAASVCDSTEVEFTIAAIGTGLQYQWYRNLQLMPQDTLPTLTLGQVDSSFSANYQCIITGTCGADTTLPIPLSVFAYPQVSILINGTELQALPANLASYEWLLNGSPVGNTAPILSNAGNGFYQVVGTNASGCSDTSFAVVITDASFSKNQDFTVFPNPSEGVFEIPAGAHAWLKHAIIRITNATGQLQFEKSAGTSLSRLELKEAASGMYLLQILDTSGEMLHQKKLFIK
jgi:hypothetical protein